MNKRIYWIDNLRAFGICLVVLVHTGRVSGLWFEDYIKSFFMPLFFFTSGLVVKDGFYENSFNIVFKKLSQRLIVPYIFFSGVSYTFWFFLFRHFKDQPFNSSKALVGIIYGSADGGWLSHNIALWFFTSLFMVQIYFYFFFKLRHRKTVFACTLVFISLLGYTCTTLYSLRLPWNLGISLTGLVFYGTGYLSSSQMMNEKNDFNRWYIMVILSFLWIFSTYSNSTVEFYIGEYGNYFNFYIAAFSGTFLFTYIARFLPFDSFLSIIGRNTLVIFSTHLLVIPLITGCLVYVIGINESELDHGVWIAIIYTMITISITLPFSILLNSKFPKVLGKISDKSA